MFKSQDASWNTNTEQLILEQLHKKLFICFFFFNQTSSSFNSRNFSRIISRLQHLYVRRTSRDKNSSRKFCDSLFDVDYYKFCI